MFMGMSCKAHFRSSFFERHTLVACCGIADMLHARQAMLLHVKDCKCMQAGMLLEEAAAAAGQSGRTLEASSVLAPLLSGDLLASGLSCLSFTWRCKMAAQLSTADECCCMHLARTSSGMRLL